MANANRLGGHVSPLMTIIWMIGIPGGAIATVCEVYIRLRSAQQVHCWTIPRYCTLFNASSQGPCHSDFDRLKVVDIEPGIRLSQIGSWAIGPIEISPPMYGMHTDPPSGSTDGGRKPPASQPLGRSVCIPYIGG